MKKILITGAGGFIGKNMIAALSGDTTCQILTAYSTTSETELNELILSADCIVHLAGANRPKHTSDFYTVNSELTKKITSVLITRRRSTPIIFTSSVHAETESDYGKSKKEAEDNLLEYNKLTGANIFIFRLPHVFGPGAKPNHNSAIATFCYNIKSDLPVTVTNPATELTLVYVEHLVSIFKRIVYEQPNQDTLEINPHYYNILKLHKKTLGDIVRIIQEFKNSTIDFSDPSDEFKGNLYTTYSSY